MNLQYLNEDSPVKCASNSTACDPQGENLIDSFAGVETIEDCRYIDEQKNQKLMLTSVLKLNFTILFSIY